MSFNQEYEKISFQKKKGEYKEQIKCECKTDIPSNEIKRVIAVLPTARIIKAEQHDGLYQSSGYINYYICYIDDQDNFRKTEARSEFSSNIKIDSEITKSTINVVVDKVDTDTSNITFTDFSYVTVNVSGYISCDYDAICGGENLITNSKEIAYQRTVAEGTSQLPIEEEFEVGYQIKQVLCQQARAQVEEVQCGEGSIIIDGKVYLSAILLQSGEKESIIKECKTIDFRGEIECEKASVDCLSKGTVSIRSFKTDIAVDEEKNISQITANIILTLDGEVLENTTCQIADDIFSKEENLDLIRADGVLIKQVTEKSIFENIKENVAIDIGDGGTLIATTNEKIEILSINEESGYIVINGNLVFTQIYQTENGYYSKKCEVVFEKRLQTEVENAEYNIYATVISLCTEKRNGIEIAVDLKVQFLVIASSKEQFKYIKEVKSLGQKSQENSSISVFIPSSGEDLWTLSKHLNASPEEIQQTNKELNFPLTGNERIVVYMQRKKEKQV